MIGEGDNNISVLAESKVISYDSIFVTFDLVVKELSLLDSTQIPGYNVRASTGDN